MLSLLSGAALLTAVGLFSQLVGFGYRIVLSRLVGAETMGLYQLIMPVYSVLLSLTAVGLTAAVSNLTPQYLALGNSRGIPQLLGTCLKILFLLMVPISAVVLLCYDPISVYWLGDARTQLGLILLLPCVALTGVENLHKHFFYASSLVRPPPVAELLEQLRNGIWQDTDHLPPELELANRLNVSRTVVRDALSELERAGYIERVRGIGTVINRDVVNLARRMDQKFEFTQMIRARGMQPNSDDLRVSRHTADADAAQALNISLDTPVYYICRRVLADNTPVLFSTDIVPCSLFGTTRTDGIDFTRPIFNILDEACGIQVSSTITHLRAAMGDPAVRHALALQRDQALLELSETCYSRLCRPVLRCRTFYTDFFDFALVRKLV